MATTTLRADPNATHFDQANNEPSYMELGKPDSHSFQPWNSFPRSSSDIPHSIAPSQLSFGTPISPDPTFDDQSGPFPHPPSRPSSSSKGQENQAAQGRPQPPRRTRSQARQALVDEHKSHHGGPVLNHNFPPHHNPQPLKRKRGRPKSQPEPNPSKNPSKTESARQYHLEKGRVAAHRCRERKKEQMQDLETRAKEYSAKNEILKQNVARLREEVLLLKGEVLKHAGCGFWVVDEYLHRCAGDILGNGSQKALQSSSSGIFSQRNLSQSSMTTTVTDQSSKGP